MPFEAPEISEAEIPAIRQTLRRPRDIPNSMRHDVIMVDRGDDLPQLDLHVYAPRTEADSPRRGLLWIHGGGYIMGSAADEAGRVAHWVRAGYLVLAPEYRLAPEHPFPAGLHDCQDALNEALRRADDLGIEPDRLIVAGGSAGGGLAAALALRCRDQGIDAIGHLVLIAPMVDDTTVPPADERLAVWGGAANRLGWHCYLRDVEHADLPTSYAAVAHETDFSGLPPTTITVGTADLFCIESIELASRLISNGVPVDLRVYPGLPHGFDSLVPDSSPTRVLQRDVFESLDRAAIFRHMQ